MDVSESAKPASRVVSLRVTPDEGLIWAVQKREVTLLQECLAAGANPNRVVLAPPVLGRWYEQFYTTPMHEAAVTPQVPELLEKLIAAGGDMQLRVLQWDAVHQKRLPIAPFELAEHHKHLVRVRAQEIAVLEREELEREREPDWEVEP